jgi:hypothetical protein
LGLCGSASGRGRGLRLAHRGLGHCVCELVAADEREDRGDGEQADRAEYPGRVLKAAGERRGYAVAGVQQRVGVAGGDARGDRDPDRAAELLACVQKPGGEPGPVLLDACQGGDRDRDERERGARAGDDKRRQQVPDVPARAPSASNRQRAVV